jgi:hypothetical protein
MIYAILVATNLLSIFALIVLLKRTMIAFEKLDEVSNQIEESLDVIDDSYRRISRHLKSPVLFDDPVVIEMVKDVKNAKEAMLIVANKIAEPFSEEINFNKENKSD